MGQSFCLGRAGVKPCSCRARGALLDRTEPFPLSFERGVRGEGRRRLRRGPRAAEATLPSLQQIAGFRSRGELGGPSPPSPLPGGEGGAKDEALSSRAQTRGTLPRMHPALRPYFDLVWPVFWPWLCWNLLRVAAWHQRTGRDALMAVDRFGNIRIVRLSDAPAPDDLYTYEAPRVPRWESPTLSSDLPVSVPAAGYREFIASLCCVYTVFYVVRECVRGPPSPGALGSSEVEARARAHKIPHLTGRQPPRRPHVLARPALPSRHA